MTIGKLVECPDTFRNRPHEKWKELTYKGEQWIISNLGRYIAPESAKHKTTRKVDDGLVILLVATAFVPNPHNYQYPIHRPVVGNMVKYYDIKWEEKPVTLKKTVNSGKNYFKETTLDTED